MSTLLEHPQAQALLDQTDVAPDDVRACARHLTAFIQRYLPFFYREEQRGHADTILRGKLTGLQRKTTEPIASQAGQKRRPLQHFVGAGQWDDPTVRMELRRHVREELGDPDAVLVLDNHGVPKQGQDSCGVYRQWCGRLGKVENCQVGYFLAYAAVRGRTLLDARLYLPRERADDGGHRRKTYVPKDVVFQEGWRIGLELLRTSGRELPHGWVTGDDEFGRASALRAQLRLDGERYVLDVPSNTLVRDLSSRRPPARADGRERLPQFERAEVWAARQPKGRWRTFRLGAGEKGPRVVRALQQRLQTKDEDGCVGPRAAGGDPQLREEAANVVHAEQRRQRSAAGRGGAGARGAARRGAVIRGREPGGGTEPLRGAQLDGLAASHDADPVGPVVLAGRTAVVGGKKIRR